MHRCNASRTPSRGSSVGGEGRCRMALRAELSVGTVQCRLRRAQTLCYAPREHCGQAPARPPSMPVRPRTARTRSRAMRFTCPACSKSYRLSREHLGPSGGAKIKCPNCQAVVRVHAGPDGELRAELSGSGAFSPEAVAPAAAAAAARQSGQCRPIWQTEPIAATNSSSCARINAAGSLL